MARRLKLRQGQAWTQMTTSSTQFRARLLLQIVPVHSHTAFCVFVPFMHLFQKMTKGFKPLEIVTHMVLVNVFFRQLLFNPPNTSETYSWPHFICHWCRLHRILFLFLHQAPAELGNHRTAGENCPHAC